MMQHGKSQKEEENEFVDKMSKLIEGKDLSESEILDLLRKELGEERGAMINAMLREGKSMRDVIDHFMKNVNESTPEEKKLTEEDKVRLMKGQLGPEAQEIMDKLGKEGYSMDQVIVDSFSEDKIRFPEENELDKNKDRCVLTLVPREEKRSIPYMHPSLRDCTFKIFFEKILEIVGKRRLTHYEIMDLIRCRMGGQYAEDFDKRTKSCYKLQEIVDYFLRKDIKLREESRELMILTLPKSVFII